MNKGYERVGYKLCEIFGVIPREMYYEMTDVNEPKREAVYDLLITIHSEGINFIESKYLDRVKDLFNWEEENVKTIDYEHSSR